MRNSLAFFLAFIAIGSAFAQTSVVGAPQPVVQEGLKYRDPKDPLTLGEVANMQRLKDAEDFLNKHGYTTIKPKDPIPEAIEKAVVEQPPSFIKIVAIYGPPNAVRAEIDHDGLPLKAFIGQRFGPYRVEAVESTGVKLQTQTKCGQRSRHQSKLKGQACNSSMRVLAVGEIVEWKR